MSVAAASTRRDVREPTRPSAIADRFGSAATVLAVLVLVQVALALAGQLTGEPLLGAYRTAGRPLAHPETLPLALLALSVLALRPGRAGVARRALGSFAAVSAAVIAALMLVRHLALAASGARVPPPMLDWLAPSTAVASILVAICALLLRARTSRAHAVRDALALVAGLVGLVSLLGHVYGVRELYGSITSTVSLPTALAILALSTAIVLARTDVGLGALLAGQGPGGQLARRMLPAAVLIPAVLGMVRVMGERHGYLSTELGTALLITTTVVLFAGASTWSAAALSRVDLARRATHRALREESLAHELERRTLRAVLEVLPVGAVITDASGRVLEVGPAARAIFGDRGRDPDVLRRYERLAGRDAATYAPLRPEDWVIARALARGETCTGQEIDVEAFDGSTKTVLASAAPIRDQRGHIAGAVGILVDITERKRAERELSSLKEELEQRVRERTAELEAANAELEALSYSISHDLRAPLRWIDGFARALSEDHAEALGESGREHLAQLHDSVRQMRELMDALLGLAHVTARPLERSRVDVGALARELARAIETENEDRRVEWRIVDGVTVDADPRLLRIALDNLLRNAWKFTRARDPAHIEVGAERADGELAIFVRDDGVGFDPRLATSLFRPFTRLHPADEYEGTGIGLALVRRIAQRHGGRAWAMAEPGRGATFYVTLAPSGGPS